MLDIRERESWANRSAERNNPQASMAMGSNDFFILGTRRLRYLLSKLCWKGGAFASLKSKP